MIKFSLALFTVLLISSVALSQTTDTSLREETIRIFTTAEKEARFPGGAIGWRNYLEKNLNANLASKYIRLKRKEKSGKQTARLQFIVDKKGNIKQVQCTNKEIHPKLAEEAIRVIKEGPKWEPAEQNGKKVYYQAIQFITFQVGVE
jgi:protein TonB